MSAQVDESASVPAADPPPAQDGSGSLVEQDLRDAPAEIAGGSLRADFGAHLEAHYPRLVGQLFAITLDSGAAHDLVQEAYSRAWSRWSEVRRGDAEAWVRRVAVRASTSPWRRFLVNLGLRRPAVPQQETLDVRTAATLRAMSRLPLAERRTAVLVYMAGMGVAEVAALEQVSSGTVAARLNRVAATLGQRFEPDYGPDYDPDYSPAYDPAYVPVLGPGSGGFASYGWSDGAVQDDGAEFPGYTGRDPAPVSPPAVYDPPRSAPAAQPGQDDLYDEHGPDDEHDRPDVSGRHDGDDEENR